MTSHDENFERLYHLALEQHRAGRITEAIELYQAAIDARPHFANAHNNLGNALFFQGEIEGAIAAYDRALTLNPDYHDAHYNRGNVLAHKGSLESAASSYRQVLSRNPYHTAALYNLGLVLCESGYTQQGFDIFERHTQLLHARKQLPHDGENDPPIRKQHDKEQREFLLRAGLIEDQVLNHLGDGSRMATTAVNSSCIRPTISEEWLTRQPQIVVVDDLLTTEALEKLRQFCWSSTIWRKVFKDGYLGATPEHGLACPLLAQIADELRASFPVIFADHRLRYLWAFKYCSTLSGTKLHADEAAVNVNFWITPAEANTNPHTGGLIVWDVTAPADWAPTKFNSDITASRAFLSQNGARPITIPYRGNRAVIFDSDLFHETDQVSFADGYLNRRINITLLFGRRRSGRP